MGRLPSSPSTTTLPARKILAVLFSITLILALGACSLVPQFSAPPSLTPSPAAPISTEPPSLVMPTATQGATQTNASAETSPTQQAEPPATSTPLPTPSALPSPTETPAPPKPLRFAAISDYGWAGQPEADVAALVKSWEPAFIITSGDNNYPDGTAATIDENIGQYYHEFIYPYQGSYGAGAEVNLFFPTLGNHDWYGTDIQPYLDYFTLPGNERYYDFTWGPVHFFALDSDSREPDGVGRSSIQAAWLKERLAASIAPWKIVYMHLPPYSSGYHGEVDWIRWPFQEWGASAVISGHNHAYERILRDGFPYFINGSGGNPNRYSFLTPVEGSQVRYREDHGAMLIEASEEQITFQFITRSGQVIDTYTLEASPEPEAVTSFPDPAVYQWNLVTDGLYKPAGLTHAGDSSGRLFVVEQPGQIRIIKDGQRVLTPFLNLADQISTEGNEQGLLGLAFHPRYTENGFFFINYTDRQGDTVVSRYNVSADPNLGDPGSETIMLQVAQPYDNHNGGHLAFGPDGNLYIGLGDGGSGGDPQGNAQNTDSLLGKLSRIDVDHGDPYAVPGDNPYVNGGGRPEIWALGLRNPWRFAFDRLTGDLYIGDVGQNQWEEIDFWPLRNPAGANFGWDYREGLHAYEGTPPAGLTLVDPVWEYDHSLGCSVTGGLVYRGGLPEWQGVYLYGDFCSGRIWGLLPGEGNTWQNALLFETNLNITAFGEDEAREVYLVTYTGGLYKLSAIVP
jgi:glucose/arabinose dehydrogenase